MKKLVIIALLLSAVAGFSVYLFVQQLQNAEAPPTVRVVAANGQIAPFTAITSDMLKQVEVPAQSAHPLSLTDMEGQAGKVALYRLEDGEVILSTKLSEPSKSGASLSYELQEGYRAMTFTIDEVSGIAGYIAAGDKLDIIALLYKQDDEEDEVIYSSMIAEGVEVIKTGVKNAEGAYSSLTLSIPAEKVLEYYYYLSRGSYRFTLRAASDGEILNPADFTAD